MIPLVYHRNVDKNDFWTAGALGAHPPLIQTQCHREHAKRRKCVAPVVSLNLKLVRSYYSVANVFFKFSTRSLLRFERKIDLEIKLLLSQIKTHCARPNRKANLSRWVQYVAPAMTPACWLKTFYRWFLYDMITDLLFNERLGFVDNGADVDGLLAAFRNTGWIIGLVALFPYFLNPLFQLPFIGRYLLPHNCDDDGVGKVMRVNVLTPVP